MEKKIIKDDVQFMDENFIQKQNCFPFAIQEQS